MGRGELKAAMDGGNVTIEMPDKLDFHKHYEESIAPILAIREILNARHARYKTARLKYIDFDPIKSMSTSASLVLAAELDIWNRSRMVRVQANPGGWDETIMRQFCELGFFELLGIKKPTGVVVPPAEKEIIKYFVGGPDDVNMAKDLRMKIEELVGASVKKHELFQGLSEAITNVSQHAYPGKNLHRYWWMTASFKRSTNQLKVVFYDRGVTIPASLPRSGLWEHARNFISMNGLLFNDDAHLIKAAMEMGRSGTLKAHRGKGLQDLLEFIKSYGKGFLSILSGNGTYKYSLEKEETTHIARLQNRMPGTLIVWSVNLPSK